ncbi:MAG: DUF2520 domain-containing protein [Legionella sp.]|uniref:Rossmann-like and DUF2520 domain-containing protein n=1 Tax=Legionella sp. TaxID=459 RepID=UPI0039E4DD81
MSLTVNIIGAGHLGKSISHLLLKNQLVHIGAVFNSTLGSSKEAIKFIGGGTSYSAMEQLPAADLTFITTPDDLIAPIAIQLAENQFIGPNTTVVHCSGSLSSEILNPIKEKGAWVASIHPMRSFANPDISVEQYKGTYCAMEGDIQALSLIKPLFEAIGSITYQINKDKKSLYHAAGVFASNYMVTLAQQAFLCLQESGVAKDMAMSIITTLMQGTLVNLKDTLSPEQALTGPIKRGDIATLEKHMAAFTHSKAQTLYSLLGKACLELTTHDANKKEKLSAALVQR